MQCKTSCWSLVLETGCATEEGKDYILTVTCALCTPNAKASPGYSPQPQDRSNWGGGRNTPPPAPVPALALSGPVCMEQNMPFPGLQADSTQVPPAHIMLNQTLGPLSQCYLMQLAVALQSISLTFHLRTFNSRHWGLNPGPSEHDVCALPLSCDPSSNFEQVTEVKLVPREGML